MKKPVLIIALILISFLLSAQEYCEWTEPQIITDVNSLYANPYVAVYNNTSWVFYEKQEVVSSIYKMDLNNLVDSVKLLSSENISYRSPYFKVSNNPNYLGYLFYISDETGNDNLYAVKLFEDNILGNPIKVADNTENGELMDYTIHFSDYIGFTIDSVVYGAELKFLSDSVYIENESVIDYSSFNIQISDRIAYWQKSENDSFNILYSDYNYDGNIGAFYWEIPTLIDSSGLSNWLISSKEYEHWYGGSKTYCWLKEDTVFLRSGWDENVYAFFNGDLTNMRQISMINWAMGVKTDFWDLFFLCFATGSDNNSEIFCSMECDYEGIYLSDNNYLDENPEVFFGEFKSGSGGSFNHYVYCIWQTHIDGKIVLSMSKSVADFTGEIKEESPSDNFLKLSPNPFSDNLDISFNTYGKNARIIVFNVYGSQIESFENLNSSRDWQSIIWNPASKISKGIYIVSLKIGGKTYTRRVIRQ